MTQFGPFLVLIGVAAVVLAALGGVVAWHNEEGRRIRRGLRRVLRGEAHALIIAHGRGRGAGFNFTSNTMAVAWDTGAWCLIYRLEELIGVELIIDGQVAGRAFRGESRRPVDILGGAEQQVTLRLVFDDPQHADFLLELWSSKGAGRRPVLDSAEAVEEANRWLARIDSVFRRRPAPAQPRVGLPAAPEPKLQLPTEPPAAVPSRPAAPPPFEPRLELPFEEDPEDADEQDPARL